MRLGSSRRTEQRRLPPTADRSLMHLEDELRHAGRVIRPKSVDALVELLPEKQLYLLLEDLHAQLAALKARAEGGATDAQVKASHLSGTIEQLERAVGVHSGSMLLSYEGILDRAIHEHSQDIQMTVRLRFLLPLHICAAVMRVRTMFTAAAEDIPSHLHDQLSEFLEQQRERAFMLYLSPQAQPERCDVLPHILVDIPNFHFLRNQLRAMCDANQTFNLTDDYSNDLRGCFLSAYEPKTAEKAVLELCFEAIDHASTKQAGPMVRAEQLVGKDHAAVFKRLSSAMDSKNGVASIFCKEDEESVCAVLRAAKRLRDGLNLMSGRGVEVLVIPIGRGDASHMPAVAPKQAQEPLSAAIPDGYTYRFIIKCYHPAPTKQVLQKVRLELEEQLQKSKSPDSPTEAADYTSWRAGLIRKATAIQEQARLNARCDSTVMPFVDLFDIADRVQEIRDCILAAAADADQQRRGHRVLLQRKKEEGEAKKGRANSLYGAFYQGLGQPMLDLFQLHQDQG